MDADPDPRGGPPRAADGRAEGHPRHPHLGHHRRRPGSRPRRRPTISITIDGVTPARQQPRRSGAQGIFTWDGDFYAQALIERLGLFESGGVLRLGIAHYNTADEIDRLLEAVEAVAVDARAAVPSAV